jgi:hypothetical protein
MIIDSRSKNKKLKKKKFLQVLPQIKCQGCNNKFYLI